MPKLIRFVITNSIIGIVIGWLIAAAMVYFNISHLGDLMLNTNHKIAAIAILGMSFGTTFGFAFLATAVYLLPYDKDEFDKI